MNRFLYADNGGKLKPCFDFISQIKLKRLKNIELLK